MQDEVIFEYLTNSYWAKGRSLKLVQRSMDNSLCVGAFANEEQVGFARVVTDFTTIAYLADVFVLPSFQGKGTGKQIVDAVVSHPELQALQLFWLATKDAHSLYEQFGFSRLSDPGKYMAIFGIEPTPFRV